MGVEAPAALLTPPSLPVADFGFARYLQSNMMAATLCGSPMYMVGAPLPPQLPLEGGVSSVVPSHVQS